MHNHFLTDAYIGLGSNLQNPITQVSEAILQLSQLENSSLYSFSNLYASRPMGATNQPPYINAVVRLKTRLDAETLLDHLQRIENNHGRIRFGDRWGPRTLDLDILVYGNYKIKSQSLTIPHPGINFREFVLHPLHEVNKNLMIPGLGVVHRLKSRCYPNGLIRLPL